MPREVDFTTLREVEVAGAPGDEAAKGFGACADLIPQSGGEAGEAGGGPTGPHGAFGQVEIGQVLGVFDRESPQPDGVDQLEDSGVGADTEGEREYGCQGEGGVQAELAECETQVLQ